MPSDPRIGDGSHQRVGHHNQGAEVGRAGGGDRRLAARAAYNYSYAAPSARNTMGKCITNAATAFVTHFDEPRAFLVALDEAIVREELCERLDARASVRLSSPLARVLSRPAATNGKSFGLALALLESGSYGLFVKLKTNWEWHEGDRATVFATVPDAYMELVAADLR